MNNTNKVSKAFFEKLSNINEKQITLAQMITPSPKNTNPRQYDKYLICYKSVSNRPTKKTTLITTRNCI